MTKTMFETIEITALPAITGGVRPQPNGGGCTGPFGPKPLFPRPRPVLPAREAVV